MEGCGYEGHLALSNIIGALYGHSYLITSTLMCSVVEAKEDPVLSSLS